MPDASSPLRTFVAFPLASATRAALEREIARVRALAPPARPVSPRDAHVTLAFIGDTPPSRVPDVVAALEGVARLASPIEAVLLGFGAFPSVERPRVLWAGVRETGEAGRIAVLAERVCAALVGLGFSIDAEPLGFTAHVTLARIDRGARLPIDGELKKALTRGTLQNTYTAEMLSDLQLMVSDRNDDGTGRGLYRPLATIPLAARPEQPPDFQP